MANLKGANVVCDKLERVDLSKVGVLDRSENLGRVNLGEAVGDSSGENVSSGGTSERVNEALARL